jgi:cell shape-determining protein MreC
MIYATITGVILFIGIVILHEKNKNRIETLKKTQDKHWDILLKFDYEIYSERMTFLGLGQEKVSKIEQLQKENNEMKNKLKKLEEYLDIHYVVKDEHTEKYEKNPCFTYSGQNVWISSCGSFTKEDTHKKPIKKSKKKK